MGFILLLRYAGQSEDILPFEITTCNARPAIRFIPAGAGLAKVTLNALLRVPLHVQ
jgi:hypothetical protein